MINKSASSGISVTSSKEIVSILYLFDFNSSKAISDEGQTVFYECKQCGHKFSVNT